MSFLIRVIYLSLYQRNYFCLNRRFNEKDKVIFTVDIFYAAKQIIDLLFYQKAFNGDGVVGNSDTDIAKIWSDGSIQWVPESIYW